MDNTPPITAVEAWRHAHGWSMRLLVAVVALLMLLFIVILVLGAVVLVRVARNGPAHFASPVEHFKYGSIGSEPASGVPYGIWKTLPDLYPADFGYRKDYEAFGFIYEADANGRRRDLPIGVSRRAVDGVDVVWLNCATCHTGTWREAPGAPRHIVPGMPSNNLDFHKLVSVLMKASTDDRLAPENLFPIMQKAGVKLDLIDKVIWEAAVLPRFREGLLGTRQRIQPLLDRQSPWGLGRVDTFNPYKVLKFDVPGASLAPQEIVGASDFPAVFNQRPREGMQLHWDGNNTSLAERNLSAAIGAGVTTKTVDYGSIKRVANWLMDLKSPPSPLHPDAAAVGRGATVYRASCASCHGWQGPEGYVFQGAQLGHVTPESQLGVDRGRLDSYTPQLQHLQVTKLFAGTPYAFHAFTKTDGYANVPLDGLWLRAPYLHNGSVPTLADLLEPPAARPAAFVRGSDVIDAAKGGMLAPSCTPGQPTPEGYCYDTRTPGNSNGGHLYGTTLSPAEKADLLAYLKTF